MTHGNDLLAELFLDGVVHVWAIVLGIHEKVLFQIFQMEKHASI